MICCVLGNAKSKTSKTPVSSGAAKGSSPEVRMGSYFSSNIDGITKLLYILLCDGLPLYVQYNDVNDLY